MKIAIIEDNPAEAERLEKRVEALLPGELAGAEIYRFPSAEAVVSSEARCDLYLIDCLLPGKSGVTLAKQIRLTQPDAAFIFTTAYLEYAAEGYETDALRYLLKPVSDEKLAEALGAFAAGLSKDPMVEMTGTTRFSDYTRASRIVYLEYMDRGSLVRLEDRLVETQKNLRTFERELPEGTFFRTSRRFLVNLRHVSEKHADTLILQNGERVTVSKRRLSAFNEAYAQYLKRR